MPEEAKHEILMNRESGRAKIYLVIHPLRWHAVCRWQCHVDLSSLMVQLHLKICKLFSKSEPNGAPSLCVSLSLFPSSWKDLCLWALFLLGQLCSRWLSMPATHFDAVPDFPH